MWESTVWFLYRKRLREGRRRDASWVLGSALLSFFLLFSFLVDTICLSFFSFLYFLIFSLFSFSHFSFFHFSHFSLFLPHFLTSFSLSLPNFHLFSHLFSFCYNFISFVLPSFFDIFSFFVRVTVDNARFPLVSEQRWTVTTALVTRIALLMGAVQLRARSAFLTATPRFPFTLWTFGFLGLVFPH